MKPLEVEMELENAQEREYLKEIQVWLRSGWISA